MKEITTRQPDLRGSEPAFRQIFRSSWRKVFALQFLIFLLALPVFAHRPSDSYLGIHVGERQITGRWDISLRDLDLVLGLDTNNDGLVTWGEVRRQQDRITAYALARLELRAAGTVGRLRLEKLEFDEHSDGVYAVLRFAVDGLGTPPELEIKYQLFFDHDPLHRGLLRLDQNGQVQTGVLSSLEFTQRFRLAQPGASRQFFSFVKLGMEHIWEGTDHILFLLALLLPAVLRREEGVWRGVESFRPAFVNVFKIVTAFTVAHSLTLSLATLEIVRLPSRLVESTIAASVLLAAANNLRPFFRGRGWLVAFGFGLVHGFGFASVLMDLGLAQGSLALTLVGFNLGVEAGQLAIVAGFLPLAFALRCSWFYQRVMFRAGSLAVVLVAAIWIGERLFDFQVLVVLRKYLLLPP